MDKIDMNEFHAELRSRLRVVEGSRAARRQAGLYDNVPTIPQLFAGKDILITGGSGFLGRVLIEKILRSCPDVGTLFLLLRPKRGVPSLERVRSIVDVPLFEQVFREQPAASSKLVPVAGDCSELGLGLSAEDRAMLQDRVAFVFHGAASVRFDDPLVKAVNLNTRGAREMIDLCGGMRKLEALVHISTAFTNSNQTLTLEKLYPTELNWRDVIKYVEDAERAGAMDVLGNKILGFHPNSYTFSKALAEQVMGEAAAKMPVIIVRPAVVVGAVYEPVIGWLDNVNSPAAIWAAVNKGVMRSSRLMNGGGVLDMIPVDVVTKATIQAAWATATDQRLGDDQEEKQIPEVVNMAITDVHPLPWRFIHSIYDSYCRRAVPFTSAIRYPYMSPSENWFVYAFIHFFYHLVFGVIVDLLLRLFNQKPRLLSVYRKINVATSALDFFVRKRFYFETTKLWKLQLLMHPDDDKGFHLQLETLHPFKDSSNQMEGILKYAFREEFDLEKGLRHIDRLFWMEAAYYVVLFAVLVYFVGPTSYLW